MDPVVRLNDAFAGRRCVSAWLGYGDVLFLGLGDDVLPNHGDFRRRVRPEFELETNFADWFVEGATTTDSADSISAQLEAAAGSLVGERVVSWELIEGIGLRIAFTGAKVLTVVPWVPTDGQSDAWCVMSPDGRILAMATDGRTVVVHSILPVGDWFGPEA